MSRPVGDVMPDNWSATTTDESFASDPVICTDDDVYEVYLAGIVGYTANRGADNPSPGKRFTEPTETWMLPDTEYAFLKFITGDNDNYVKNCIAYATKNHWFGGKRVCLNLNISKPILSRQIKLVLHNPKQRKCVSSTPKTLRKTDFVLEDWPYGNINQPLIPKGNSDDLAPWKRLRNKQFNAHITKLNHVPLTDPRVPFFRPHPAHINWQMAQQQQRNVFHTQSQVLAMVNPATMVYSQVPMVSVNRPHYVHHYHSWQNNNTHHRFPTPYLLPPPLQHYHWNMTRQPNNGCVSVK